MAVQGARTPSTKRFHIVLIPGFAGFDALGQLEYYSGITPLFQTCSLEIKCSTISTISDSGGGHARYPIAKQPCPAHCAR
jgi:hypothetical protein